MTYRRIDTIVFLLVLLELVTGGHADETFVFTPKVQLETTRTLSFPSDGWLGNLYLVPESGLDWDQKGVRPEGQLEHFSATRGEVRVPGDRQARLSVRLALDPREAARLRRKNPRAYQALIGDRVRECPDDLSGLSQLDPNGLFWLAISSPMYRRTGVAPEVFEPIRRLAGLEILSLHSTGITDAGLAHLRFLRSLKGLELTQFPIGNRGLAVLKDLPALEYLSLNTGVTDAGLKQVAQISSLRWLQIVDGKMWGPGLAELGNLPRLERLCIQQSRSRLSDRNIKYLEGLTQLKALTFWANGCDTLTDASLASISKLKNLEELYFIRTSPELTPVGVAHLKNLQRLKKVDFGQAWLSPAGAQHGDDIARLLATMPQLESIKRIAHLSDEGMKAIATMPNLTCLFVTLRDRKLGYHGPSGLSHLARLRSLETLHIESGDQLPDADLASLEALADLKDLLIANPGVSEHGLASIGKLRQLESLHLKTLTRSGLNYLNGLSNLKYLKASGPWGEMAKLAQADEGTLDLSGLTKIKDLNLVELPFRDGDLAFLKDLPLLENVMIGATSPLPGTALRHLTGLPQLNRLYVGRLSDCTGKDLAHLNELSKLRSVILAGDIPDAALVSLTGPEFLESFEVRTDNPIRKETVTELTAVHPVIEYVRINTLTPVQSQPADVPQRTRPNRQAPPNRRRRR